MIFGKGCKAVPDGFELRRDDSQSLPHLQDEAGIDDVLTRRTPMHPARRLFIARRDQSRQRLHQWDGEIAAFEDVLSERLGVEILGSGRRADRSGRRVRDHPARRFGTGKRRLDIQHRLNTRTVGENPGHGFAAEETP